MQPTEPRRFTVTGVADAVNAAVPHRAFIVHGEEVHTYADVIERSRRFAGFLATHRIGCHTERSGLLDHQSGQNLVGLCAYNGSPFVETLLGSFRARAAPFNVNYRYTTAELRYLLTDSASTALVYQAEFAPQVAQIRHQLPNLRVLVQIADQSGEALLDGALDYASIVTAPSTGAVGDVGVSTPSPDDLYVLYTGGTTGMPKGVLWRQHDIFMSALGGRDPATGAVLADYSEVSEKATAVAVQRRMILPPLIHGAAQWAVLAAMTAGHTVVFADNPRQFDPDEVVRALERHRVSMLALVGDAMARPIADALERAAPELPALTLIASGGAPLTRHLKQRLHDSVPRVGVVDSVGSSETGAQMHAILTGPPTTAAHFVPGPDTVLIAEDYSRVLSSATTESGWLAQRNFVPLGYLGDATKTAQAFRAIGERRYAIAGDRARWHPDGTIELLGRDSMTVNSGGEKIFVEEVEAALVSHYAVADVMVIGRPSQRWGQEVVALIALSAGEAAEPAELIEHAASTLARYKLPKAVLFYPQLQRSAAGKADYRWAREQVAQRSGE